MMTATMRSVLVFLGFLALSTYAFQPAAAQDAPPEAQLAAPMGELPQPTAAAPVEPPAVPVLDSPVAQRQPAGGGSATFDPCPAPQDAIGSSPDDLAKLQEDIDRFTLCVQRAQLLERLNETALKSEAAADLALGLAGSVPGIPDAQTNGLAPLPASALAGADVSPLDTTKQGAPVPDDSKASTPAPQAEPEPAEPPSAPWTIREIYGSGPDIQAKLLSPEGDENRVREGSKLPDGKGTVVRITPTGVTVRIGSDTKELNWANR